VKQQRMEEEILQLESQLTKEKQDLLDYFEAIRSETQK
jgi:hypothetical protein